MNPINPWLDPAEVRRLAEKLLAPPADALDDPAADPGFDTKFVGFASQPPTGGAGRLPAAAPGAPHRDSPPPPAAVPAPAPFSAPPVPTAPPPTVASQPIPPPVTPPPAAALPTAAPATSASSARGPLLERIRRFRDWLHDHFAATGIFILDRDGAVIFDDSGHGRLHFLARSLALTSRRPGSPAGNVHVKIGTAATLEVIPVETPYGWLVLGAVVAAALPPATVTTIIDALTQIATPPPQSTEG
jgi:hypothetical protein